MVTLRKYGVFISHAWQYHGDYDRFVNLLRGAPYFDWRNLSVPVHSPVLAGNTAGLKRELNDQMRTAHVVVVLGGIYVSHSFWIQYEIDQAVAWGKAIIGVQPWGSTRTPAALTSYADRIVGWNTSSVVAAIRQVG